MSKMSKAIATNKPIHSGKETLLPQEKKLTDKEQRQYVGSFAALIDKYIQYLVSGERIPLGIVLIVMGLIFVQDNGAGRLKSLGDLLWTTMKCSFPVAVYLIYCVSRRMSLLFKQRKSKTKKKPTLTKKSSDNNKNNHVRSEFYDRN